MQDSQTLVLEISKHDARLVMSISGQDELVSTIRHYSHCALQAKEIDKLCREVTSILNRAAGSRAPESELLASLRKTGQVLWDGLLTRPVKDRLLTTQISDLVLSIDEGLVHIPWELLFDGREFLCLKFNLGRLVRTSQQYNPCRYRSLDKVLKMLILANPTQDLKSAYQEGVYIRNQFDSRRAQVKIDFKSTRIDTLYVKKNLRDYDMVHFAGHSEYDPQSPEKSGWVLNDGILTTKDILALGESQALPTLIFSNTCHSAKVEAETLRADYQEKTYSLAAAFLFSGVTIYVGTIRRIEDSVSLLFAREFYTHLIRGKKVGESLRLGRLRLIEKCGASAIPWASYLLYGDPNFVLFKTSGIAHKLILKRKPAFDRRRLLKIASAAATVSLGVYLYLWWPSLRPDTYFLFLKSRRLYLKGMNQEVILSCRKIIEKEPLFLAIYPLLADTYQRLGRREETLKYYFDYALSSEKRHDKKNLASAYVGIGWIYQGQGEYAKAFDFYDRALALSRQNQDRLNEAAALRKMAVWYIDKGDNDKALELLTKSSEINRSRQQKYEHRYNLACDYFDIGLVFTNKGDLAAAKEFYRRSQLLFGKLRLKNELSDYYFNMGEIYLFEKQYQKALDCYMQGLRIDQAQGNKPSIASDYNMLGELYAQMGNFPDAEGFFNQAVLAAQEINAPLELVSAYHNLWLLLKDRGHRLKAKEYLRQAREICLGLETPDCSGIKEEFLASE